MFNSRTVAAVVLLTACGSEQQVAFQTNVDTFAQAPNNEVDILWVIDDSNSMSEEQTPSPRGSRHSLSSWRAPAPTSTSA